MYETTTKEQIRKKIKEALIEYGQNPYLKEAAKESDTEINHENEFISKYKESGGFFIRCTTSNFQELFSQFLTQKKYDSILNTYLPLNSILKDAKVNYENLLNYNSLETFRASIHVADALIASTGSLVFSGGASIYGISKTVLILARQDCIVPDIKTAYQFINPQNQKNLIEITKPCVVENGNYTVNHPLFILFLIA